MKKSVLALAMLFFLGSCSSVDVFIIQEKVQGRPGKILIGYLEKRNLNFDPFISKNFRDSLKFELFKRGYNTELLDIPKSTEDGKSSKIYCLGTQEIRKYCDKYSADIFLQGILSERSYGDALDRETSTMVTLQMYNKIGEKVGEARYITSDTLSDMEALADISASLVKKIDGEISG